MKKEKALFDDKYAYIFNWKQRIEAVSGLTCPYLSQMSDEFSEKELKEAFENDRCYFKGLVENIQDLI